MDNIYIDYMKKKLLALKQLDRKIKPWLEVKNYFQPKNGWINCMRKALGMTLPQLAKRMNISRTRVIKIQQSEIANNLTIHTLQEAAKALQCDFVYAFIPHKSLEGLIRDKAEKIAKQSLHYVSHTMALENQAVDSIQQQEQLEELISTLISETLKKLWDYPDEI